MVDALGKTIAVALVCAVLNAVGSTLAHAAPVGAGVMTVSGGSFVSIGSETGLIWSASGDNVGTGSLNIAGQYNLPGWDVNVSQTGPAASAIISFPQSGLPWLNAYTAPTSSQIGGGPFAPPGGLFEDSGGVTTFDISAFYVNWSGTDFNMGSPTAVLTTSDCVMGACRYSLDWTNIIYAGFNVITSTWQLTGTVSAVPVPSAVWLLGSGLFGLLGAARWRRR